MEQEIYLLCFYIGDTSRIKEARSLRAMKELGNMDPLCWIDIEEYKLLHAVVNDAWESSGC